MTPGDDGAVAAGALAFQAADGETLQAMLFEPAVPIHGPVLVAGGLGIPQSFYVSAPIQI